MKMLRSFAAAPRRALAFALTTAGAAFSATAAAQMSAALRDGGRATTEQWHAARPVLQAAMTCHKPLVHTDAVRAVFRRTNDHYDGEHKLPAPMGVYGYPTALMTIVDGWKDEPVSYSVDLEAPIGAVVRTAGLSQEHDAPGRYGRRVPGGGHLVAVELESHDVRLTCSWPPPGGPK